MPDISKMWFVGEQLGAPSETWLLRQLERFEQFSADVFVWNDAREQIDQTPIHLMNAPRPGLSELGWKRWPYRMARVSSGNFYGASRAEQTRLADIAHKTGKPSVILAHYGHTALRFLPVAKRLGVPLVAHFHGADISASFDSNKWYRRSLLRAMSDFAACICVGHHQAARINSIGQPKFGTHYIPCGVPTAEFTPVKRTPQTPIRFATLSRLVNQKGVDICLRALAKLPDAEITIMGDGPERAGLETLAASLGLGPRAHFTGSVTPQQARQHLAQTDVFLQHSLEIGGAVEGFGVSVAEASAMGLPVIVSNSGGLRDQVIDGKTGIIVPMRNADALAQAMSTLSNNPSMRVSMGQAGRARMVAEFDTEGQVKALENVLKTVCKG